jgi:hypothetical protein
LRRTAHRKTAGSVVGTLSCIDGERIRERDCAEGYDLGLEKSARVTRVPNPGIPQFLFIVVLYTVTVLNECQQAATDVKLLDEV